MPEKTKKIRADQLLVEQGLAVSRARAQSLILAGSVFYGTEKIEKPSQLFSADILLEIKGKDHPYVSRGGLKLKGAIDSFQIQVKDKICLDIGASTGGFTDCLLKTGAKKVYALDVGYGQLDWSLRQDPRVIVLERVNFRYFEKNKLNDLIDLVTIDVSFISLKMIIPKVMEIFEPKSEGILIALIKPQFEVGKEFVGKGGIVKDDKKRKECVKDIHLFCEQNGFEVQGVILSPILGQMGNQEFLLVGTKKGVL